MKKRKATIFVILTMLFSVTVSITACSNTGENEVNYTGFDASEYIKSVDSKLESDEENSDNNNEVNITVTIYNKWKELTDFEDRNQVRLEAISKATEEAQTYDDVIAANLGYVDEDGNAFDMRMEDPGEKFISGLKTEKFLPEEVIAALPEYPQTDQRIEREERSTFYIWNTYDKNAANPEETDIHNIQLSVTNGKIVFYHYKNYSFDVPLRDKPMPAGDALKMVDNFAKLVASGLDNPVFKNDPNSQVQSLYDPGHIETWSSTIDGITYDIVVDLDMGGVIYYNAGENDD